MSKATRISRIGRQLKSFFRAQNKLQEKWTKEGFDYQTVQLMLVGHANGWLQGIRWAKRKSTPKNKR